MIEKRDFGGYAQYILDSDSLSVSVTELGATVTGIRFKDRERILSYDKAEDYLTKAKFICTFVGRYANRIGKARFSLNGKEYILPANEGQNQLHGGPDAYDRRRWRSEVKGGAVRFELDSPDGDGGFPGNLTAAVTYSVEGSTLRMDFEGVCDADTVYAPTSHMYFALNGGSCLDYVLQINAGRYVEVDGELIPTGRLLPTEGAFDFNTPRPIGQNYDHCFVLDSTHACTVKAENVTLEVHTDFPAVQIYTGSKLKAPFVPNSALAIEPEFLPDSPNHPDFPSTVLKAGENFHRYMEFKFI